MQSSELQMQSDVHKREGFHPQVKMAADAANV
jgi:hypothetical protein